jgi:hypothetical protein
LRKKSEKKNENKINMQFVGDFIYARGGFFYIFGMLGMWGIFWW